MYFLRLPIIRHIRWFFLPYWFDRDTYPWLRPTSKEMDYIDDVWEGKA